VASFPNLGRATRRAALDKRDVSAVARFLADREPSLLRLQRETRGRDWASGRAFTFKIHAPKTRCITAAPFEDRVQHHALIDVWSRGAHLAQVEGGKARGSVAKGIVLPRAGHALHARTPPTAMKKLRNALTLPILA